MKDPQTKEEWKEAANAAQFLLLLDSARMYGLVNTSIQVNSDRCVLVLQEAKRKGITPDSDEALCKQFMQV